MFRNTKLIICIEDLYGTVKQRVSKSKDNVQYWIMAVSMKYKKADEERICTVSSRMGWSKKTVVRTI